MNVSSTNNFAPNLRSHLLSYYRCYSRCSSHYPVNVFSIDKPTNLYSCFMSSSTSSQTFVGADTSWIYNPHPCYFYNSCYRLNMADSLETMRQELLRPKNWISFTVPDSHDTFLELPAMDIPIIGVNSFNTLMQQASYATNMEIFNISI